MPLTGQDLVGADGETHQGCFDLSYLIHDAEYDSAMAPKNGQGAGGDAGICRRRAWIGPGGDPLSERQWHVPGLDERRAAGGVGQKRSDH